MLPAGVAYDSSGNLYIAEVGRNVVRKLAPGGMLTTVAGTGVQGFSGDGGPALSADFDSPQSVALDPAGNLLIADTHNHRIRRVDAASGKVFTVAGGSNAQGSPAIGLPVALAVDSAGNVFIADAATHRILRLDAASGAISVVAGDGTEGYTGDAGPALAASLDSPGGLAVDRAGDLFISDTHNQRVRRVDHLSGIITSLAGTGKPGFSGDSSSAGSATLRLPRGLAVDSSGNLLMADSANHRIRRIDAASGEITTLAGDGTEGYSGDSGPAAAASLDSPRGVALSSTGTAVVADTHNDRVRQIDSAQSISTIAGLGSPAVGGLNLAAPASFQYGSGVVTVTFAGSAATGTVAFYDLSAASPAPQLLASEPLADNAASLPLGTLPAGEHHLSAVYSGDPGHTAAQSRVVAITISPAPATASLAPVSSPFGAGLPVLSGTLTGILPQDAQLVALLVSSTASSSSAPGSYPTSGTLTGPAAANYLLTSRLAPVTITRAPALASLSAALAVHLASSTSGTPSGTVSLLDGATVVQTAALDPGGNAAFSAATLSSGSHTLSALYAGDSDFLAAQSAPLLLSTGTASTPDFTLAATGSASQSISSGGSAAFAFSVARVHGMLNSAIQLAVSGIPPGASASFNPAYLPPGSSASTFTLSVQTAPAVVAAGSETRQPGNPSHLPLACVLGLPLMLLLRRRSAGKLLLFGLSCAVTMLVLNGCGSRTSAPGAASTPPIRMYNLTITATATTDSGATLQHAADVTLNVN